MQNNIFNFKAAILEEIDHPLAVGDVFLTELKIGQVLVKILVSGLCGAQLQEIRGEKDNAKYVPHLVGHEGCGVVEAIGPGVTRIKEGDKVIMHWRKGDGIESSFPQYIYNDNVISSGRVTTLSQYSIASENRLTPVPQDTPEVLCALLGCGLSTALGVINNDAKIKFGESVLVLGCGGIGINLIQGSNIAGAGDVFGCDISEDKRRLVEHFKAAFIHSKNIETLTSRIDCIIDTTGSLELISRVLPVLSDRGRVIIISQPRQNSTLTFIKPANFFLGEGQSISSTQGGKINPSTDLRRYINLYKKGVLKVDNIITHLLPLSEINTAITLLKEGKAGRILINPW